jgi:hypothetical protein
VDFAFLSSCQNGIKDGQVLRGLNIASNVLHIYEVADFENGFFYLTLNVL